MIGGPDIERLRKVLVRTELFRRTLDVPGDIVEAGVFKGTGLMLWLKLLEIFAPGSAKRVVGFDLFEGFGEGTQGAERAAVEALLAEARFTGTTPATILDLARSAGFPDERCELVAGDIASSATRYCEEHPGFRISLLHLDLDLAAPTLGTLRALWPRVVRGGLVIFDEYAVPRWTESEAVDAWLAEQGHELQRLETLRWSRTPTAWLVK